MRLANSVVGVAEPTQVYTGQVLSTVTTTIMADVDFDNKDFDREFSPVTLNHQWSWIWRLFFLLLFTGSGTLVNAFFVTTFCISQELKKKGNLFLASLGFADLLITSVVVPSVIVIMLSQADESVQTCQILQMVALWSTYIYSVFFMLVAVDIYTRLVSGYTRYRVYMSSPISLLALFCLSVTYTTACAGAFLGLDYDYCYRKHHGNYWFRLITSITFYIIPFLVTVSLLLKTSYVMKDRVVRLIRYRRHQQYRKDRDLTNLHLMCYSLFVAAWIPYLVIVNVFPDTSDATYYSLIWIGLIRSAITSFLYSAANENFRYAFYNLFVYFCCKSYAARPSNSRRRRCIAQNAQLLNNENNLVANREPPVPFVI